MKYKIFTSDSIETLYNEIEIGAADNYQDACIVIKKAIPQAAANHYWRLSLGENATFIDYGSWSKFVAIVPPVSIEEIMRQN